MRQSHIIMELAIFTTTQNTIFRNLKSLINKFFLYKFLRNEFIYFLLICNISLWDFNTSNSIYYLTVIILLGLRVFLNQFYA